MSKVEFIFRLVEILYFFVDHVNYVGEDEKFGAIAISYKRIKTIVPHPHEEEGNIIHYEYQVIVRTSEVRALIDLSVNYVTTVWKRG